MLQTGKPWPVMLTAGALCSMVACFAPREMYTKPADLPQPGSVGEAQMGAAGSQQPADEPTVATATNSGVTVSARLLSDAPMVQQYDVTVIDLVIDNRSGRPLRFSHGDIALVAGEGTPYGALPPRWVSSTGKVEPLKGVEKPTPGPQSSAGTAAMAEVLEPIPEGVVGSDKGVAGIVYFEQVPPEIGHVRVVIQLIDARDHAPFGRIELPISRPAASPVE